MLKEFFAVSSYPTLATDRPFTEKFILLLKIYGIVFLLNIFSAPLSYLVDSFVTHVLHFKSIQQQYKTSMQGFFTKFGYWKAVFYISILAPVIEECIFRLALSFKRMHIAVAFGFALVLLARLVPGVKNQNLEINISVRAALFAIGFLMMHFLLPKHTVPNKKAQTWLIIVSTVTFGLMHIFNYVPLQWGILFIYPLYILPQLCMGWFLTYIRFKNGFFWGIGLHALINSVAMLIYTIAKHN